MANYFDITYSSSAPADGLVQVANADDLWVTHDLQVVVSLLRPSSLTTAPFEYKVWGIDGVIEESGASWTSMSAESITITGTLNSTTSEFQYVSAKFKDADSESDVVTSSGIAYYFTEPSFHPGVEDKNDNINSEFGGESIRTGVIRNKGAGDTGPRTEVIFDKDNIAQLRFHSLDMSGIRINGTELNTSISLDSNDLLSKLVNANSNNRVRIKTVFSGDTKPLIRVKESSTDPYVTLTQYDGSEKTDLSASLSNRVHNYSYDDSEFTVEFDVSKFSQYGFTTISDLSYTANSQTAGYVGYPLYLRARVMDDGGEGVEGAPVTFSGSGDNIGTLVSGTIYTDSTGLAEATLNLTTAGSTTYTASIPDGFSDTQLTYCYETTTLSGYQRSLLRQDNQIERSLNYDDSIVNVNDSSVATPTTPTTSGGLPDYRAESGDYADTLEHDLNVYRTLLKQIKGTTDWFGGLGTYFDPTDTDASSSGTKVLNMSNIKDHSLDSKTIIVAVTANNSGAGFTVTSGTEGFLFAPTDTRYADWNDRRGLPIFQSTANAGSYFDEGGNDNVCVIDLIDTSTGSEFKDAYGNIIYGKFHDGADYPTGSGEGTDVYVKFYSDDSSYTWTGTDPDNILIVHPLRRVMTEVEEYEWMRTDFVRTFEGDTAIVSDINDLWSFTGASNNEDTPSWTNLTNYYPLTSGTSGSLTEAINILNDELGDRLYTTGSGYYLTDGDPITSSLDDLNTGLYTVAGLLAAGDPQKYLEEVSADIDAGIEHTLPGGITYTPESTAGKEGFNMDVYVNGQLLTASTGPLGVEADRDYSETSVSGVTFHRDIYKYSNIIYVIRQ